MEDTMNSGMRRVVDRAKKDRAFLYQLLTNPAEATKDFELSEEERQALGASTIGRLGSLVDVGALVAAGCGSSPTCDSTCTATCTVTFTSIQGRGDIVARAG
jgi:hypothetical protein